MNPIEIEGKIRALEVMMYEGRGASVRCAPARGSGAADTWAGKCEACGAEYSELPANDEGVCAKCGCHSVVERREPPLPNIMSQLSFDGFGINGPDKYRTRLATFTNDEAGKAYGKLFEASPDLLDGHRAALQIIQGDLREALHGDSVEVFEYQAQLRTLRGIAMTLEAICSDAITKAKSP